MRYPRIYRFLCKAQKGSKRYDCEKFAIRVGYPLKKFVRNVLPTNGWAIPFAALPLILLGTYKSGHLTGVRHQSPAFPVLFVLFTLVFAGLYILLGGLCRYYALRYFLAQRAQKMSR